MGDEARERLRRRLQRYRQHHEASCCRYDNHINIVSEQQQEHTRLLHKRWLESQYDSSRKKRVKLAVVDEGTSESSDTSVNVHTSKSLLRSTEVNCQCLVSPSEVLAVSKLQMNCADSTCCVRSGSDTHVPCLSVPVSTDCMQRPVSKVDSQYDSLAVAEMISSTLISSSCESTLEDCSSGAGCEASNKTSSNAELLSCDTVIACSASY